MEHALPRRTAGTPRTWSLCMTSENHGTVGPAGCKFSHAPEKHERVLVVEVPAAAGAPVDQVNLQLVGARKDLPVAEFEGYVDGVPLVRWMDRDNMPRVGTKLYAAPVAAQAGHDDDADVTGLEVRDALGDQYDPEVGEAVSVLRVMAAWKAEAELGAKYKQMACGTVQAAPVAVQPAPVPAERIECWSHNEEDFNAQSLGELIDTHEMQPGATVWVGEAVHPDPSSLFSTNWLIENMGEAAYDIAGEHGGEDYPNVSDEQVAELEALVVGWITKCAPPTFWTVKNVRPYVLTAEDCGDQASTSGERQEGGA